MSLPPALHLDRTGHPLASLETWRVASPTNYSYLFRLGLLTLCHTVFRSTTSRILPAEVMERNHVRDGDHLAKSSWEETDEWLNTHNATSTTSGWYDRAGKIHLHGVLTKKRAGITSRSLSFLLGLKIGLKPPSSAGLSSSPNERAVPPRSYCVQPGSLCAPVRASCFLLPLPNAPSVRSISSAAPSRTGSDVAESLRLVLPPFYTLPRAALKQQ